MTNEDRDGAIAVVESLLKKMNHISDTREVMTLSDIQQLFTNDCEMVLNNTPICKGHDGLLLHSNDITKKLKSWHFNLPFDRTVVEAGQVFVYYTCDTEGLDGARGRAYDMCIYSVQDGKISDVCEVVHFSGYDPELDSFV